MVRCTLMRDPKALGPEHTDVTRLLNSDADLLRSIRRYAEASKMKARAKAIRAKYE